MDGDREKCIAAGMDDYISKPVNCELMFQFIEKYCKPHNEAPARADAFKEQIQEFAAQTGLGEEDVLELFKEFMDSLPEVIVKMGKAIQQEDYVELKKIAHQLKGSSGNLRMNNIADKAIQIEKYASDSKKEQCLELFKDLKKNYRMNLKLIYHSNGLMIKFFF
ncbi:MAG TPA: hypothetical protein DDW50_12755 [Firmicutes bacterium]|nr:hypothetical protein [Bacillota bacterium]